MKEYIFFMDMEGPIKPIYGEHFPQPFDLRGCCLDCCFEWNNFISNSRGCHIQAGIHLAELLIKAKLIIWDETPMANKYCFETLDLSLRDILRFSNPDSIIQMFYDKVIVIGGDFKQILHPKVYLLECDSLNYSTRSNNQDKILNPISAIVDATYPDLLQSLSSHEYFRERVILAPTMMLLMSIPIMLVRNIDQSIRSINSTNSYKSWDENHKSSSNISKKVVIPRMFLIPSDSSLQFKFQRG
ncbi:hypothetical protein V2J09_015826 [Rumex salicifolius]